MTKTKTVFETIKKVGRGVCKFCTYLFWPQRTDKARYFLIMAEMDIQELQSHSQL